MDGQGTSPKCSSSLNLNGGPCRQTATGKCHQRVLRPLSKLSKSPGEDNPIFSYRQPDCPENTGLGADGDPTSGLSSRGGQRKGHGTQDGESVTNFIRWYFLHVLTIFAEPI